MLVRGVEDRLYLKKINRNPQDFTWSKGPQCPRKRVEAVGTVINDRVYLFNGYETIGHVHNRCDVFDLGQKKWVRQFDVPEYIPQTHLGLTSENNRFIYFIGGQLGPHCSPCTDKCYVLDLKTEEWGELPRLPAPRYLGVVLYYDGRIHVIGGSDTDRNTPANNHWTISVRDGRAVENSWQEEAPVSRGGIHRGHIIYDGAVYIIGGSEGDVKAVAGDPQFRCDWDTTPELMHGESYRYDFKNKSWSRLADMPLKLAHSDTGLGLVGDEILMFGGTLARHKCGDVVLRYNIKLDKWDIAGRLPYPMKSTFVAYYAGRVYLITGQRSASLRALHPKDVLHTVWTSPYPFDGPTKSV